MDFNLLRLRQIFNPNSGAPYPRATPPFIGDWDASSPGGIRYPGQQPTPTFDQPTQDTGFMPPPKFPLPQTPDAEIPQQPQDEMSRIQAMMNKLYTPETEATTRYNDMIKNMPQQQTGQGKLRKIAAITLAAMADRYGSGGGQQTFRGIMYPGFDRDMSKWKEQEEPAYRAANLERQNNMNERTMAYQTISAQLRDEAQAARNAKDAAAEKLAQQKLALVQFKTMNPGVKVLAPKGGNFQLLNPVTKEIQDTGIPVGSVDEMTRIALMHENQMALEDKRQTNREGLEDMRQTNRIELVDHRADTKQETELPLNTSRRQTNTANLFTSRFPQWADYLSFDDNGNFTHVVPRGNSGKMQPLSAEDQRKLTDAIFSGDLSAYDTPAPQFQKTNVPPPTTAKPTSTPATGTGRSSGPAPTGSGRSTNAGGRSNTPPATAQSKGPNVLNKMVRNKKTGEVITVYSRDGGKTWTRN